MGKTRSTFTEATLAEEVPLIEDLLAAGRGGVVVDQPGNRRGPRVVLHREIAHVEGPKGMEREEVFGRLAGAQIEYWPGFGFLPPRVEQWQSRVLMRRECVRVPYHGSQDRLTFALTVLRAMGSKPEDGRWRRRWRSYGEGFPPSTKPPKAWWLASDGRWYPPEKKPGRPEG